jgi:proline dehydrogenase
VIREAISSLARNQPLGDLLARAPLARTVVTRVVGGETVEDAMAVASELADRGLWVSLERAWANDDGRADELLQEYLDLVDRLSACGLGGVSEVAVFPSALDAADEDPVRLTTLCRSASRSGVAVMAGMGPLGSVDATLAIVDTLHRDGLLVGVTLQANLKRTEADCSTLADRRVRLVKGGHRADATVAHVLPSEIDKAFVRCAKTLLRGSGQPSFATHDPRLIRVVEGLAARYGRPRQTFEFAFYLGRQEAEQDRLAGEGDRVRVYVPYGPDWFGRIMGGLAEQPTSIASAVRSLLPGSSVRRAGDPSADGA